VIRHRVQSCGSPSGKRDKDFFSFPENSDTFFIAVVDRE
jgi:hypothetical protein